MTDTVENSGAWKSINLNYFFWLPAGKDEFGFKDFASAPLSDTAFYRDLVEETISVRFARQVEALRDGATNRLGFMHLNTPVTRDGELGLRKIHFKFNYEPSHDALRGVVREGLINGAGTILSNGLYLWSFNIEYRSQVSEADLRVVLERFLMEDFIERHVRHLFDFKWNTATAAGRTDGYKGVLTYYQLDLLFNGVLDPAGHPHLALEEKQHNGPVRGDDERARGSYAVQSLIKSLSLCAIGKDYFPLFDKRKDYSLRGTHQEAEPHIRPDLELLADWAINESAVDDREIFLSRLSFAAMEHFLRVAISFGLIHYKTGLDHIRSELVDMGMRSHKNRASGELRRPSLAAKALTVADLEAHQTLLAGKLPVLNFLLDLVNGLADTSHPLREITLNGRPGAAEWRFAKSTLDEARTQFQRQVSAIQADVSAIEASLNAVRTDMMLLELTEARKLQEIAAESVRVAVETPSEVEISGGRVQLDPGQLDKPLAVVALVIGGFEIVSGMLLFITDKVFSNTKILPADLESQHVVVLTLWGLGILMLMAAFWLGIRNYYKASRAREHGKPSDDGQPQDRKPPRGRPETHVFDYSSLLRDVQGESAEIMEALCTQMVDIEAPRGARVECVNYSTLRETPSSGTERIKYSLESPDSASGLSYILHVEVERRLSGRAERLQDIRLVVRRPTDARSVEVVQAAAHVIAGCLQALVFTAENQGEVRTYMLNRMGLNLESAAPAKGRG